VQDKTMIEEEDIHFKEIESNKQTLKMTQEKI
jgi:hypothetical protein